LFQTTQTISSVIRIRRQRYYYSNVRRHEHTIIRLMR